MALDFPDDKGLYTITDTTDDELLTDIGSNSLQVRDYDWAMMQVGLSGGSVIDFDQFVMLAEAKDSTVFSTLLAAWTVVNTGPFVYGENLATLPHGSTRFVILDLRGLDEIKFQSAQAAATASVVTRLINMFLQRVR